MTDKYIRKQDAVNAINEALKRVFTEHVGEGIINPLEPADVAPVVHGRWIHMQSIYGVAYCSECSYELHAQNVNFCPNCGAKTDGGKNG